MAIPEEFKARFDFLLEAAGEDQGIALVECRRKSTGQKVYAVVAVTYVEEDGEAGYHLAPLAVMLPGDGPEFDDIEPPDNDDIVEAQFSDEGPPV